MWVSLLAAVVIMWPGQAWADTSMVDTEAVSVESPLSFTYARLLGEDLVHTFAAPLYFDEKDWLLLAGGAVVVGGAMAGLDEPVRDFLQRNRSQASNNIADRFDRFGMNYPSWLMGGFYFTGLVTDNRTAKLVALDGIAANVIAGNLVSPLLKRVVGRYRIYDSAGPHRFDLWSDHSSFPSGHVTRAFANAAVISAHYRQTWVRVVSYVVASMVAFSRMNFDVHWLSDTLASAGIGMAIGYGVVHLNRKLRMETDP